MGCWNFTVGIQTHLIYTPRHMKVQTPTVAITQFSNDDRRLHVLVAYSDGALRYFQYAPESQIVTENLNHANIFAKYNFTFVRSPVFIDFDNDGDIDLVANKANTRRTALDYLLFLKIMERT